MVFVLDMNTPKTALYIFFEMFSLSKHEIKRHLSTEYYLVHNILEMDQSNDLGHKMDQSYCRDEYCSK